MDSATLHFVSCRGKDHGKEPGKWAAPASLPPPSYNPHSHPTTSSPPLPCGLAFIFPMATWSKSFCIASHKCLWRLNIWLLQHPFLHGGKGQGTYHLLFLVGEPSLLPSSPSSAKTSTLLRFAFSFPPLTVKTSFISASERNCVIESVSLCRINSNWSENQNNTKKPKRGGGPGSIWIDPVTIPCHQLPFPTCLQPETAVALPPRPSPRPPSETKKVSWFIFLFQNSPPSFHFTYHFRWVVLLGMQLAGLETIALQPTQWAHLDLGGSWEAISLLIHCQRPASSLSLM